MTKCRMHYGRSVELPAFVARCLMNSLAAANAPTAVLLSGRPGAEAMLQELLAMAESQRGTNPLQWLQLFQIDAFEGVRDGPEDPWQIIERNFAGAAVKSNLLRADQLHPFRFSDDRTTDLKRYEAELQNSSTVPPLVVLVVEGGTPSSGDPIPGHFAGIYPGCSEAWETEAAFIETVNSPLPPKKRVTATPALLRKSGRILAMLCGNHRISVWNEFRNSGETEREVPLRLLHTSESHLLCCDVFQS